MSKKDRTEFGPTQTRNEAVASASTNTEEKKSSVVQNLVALRGNRSSKAATKFLESEEKIAKRNEAEAYAERQRANEIALAKARAGLKEKKSKASPPSTETVYVLHPAAAAAAKILEQAHIKPVSFDDKDARTTINPAFAKDKPRTYRGH